MARRLLVQAAFAYVVVSHDRYFLENVTNEVAELNRTYPDGLLRVHGNYSAFLRRKKNFSMLNRSARRPWKTWFTPRSSGFGEE